MEFSGFPELCRNDWNYRNRLLLSCLGRHTFAFGIGYDPDRY